jgi:hypothetical protein
MNGFVDRYPDVDLPPDYSQEDGEEFTSAQRSEAVLQKSLVNGLTKSPLWVTIVARLKVEIAACENTIFSTVVNDKTKDGLNVIKGERQGLLKLENWIKELYGSAEEVSALYRKADQLKEREEDASRG